MDAASEYSCPCGISSSHVAIDLRGMQGSRVFGCAKLKDRSFVDRTPAVLTLSMNSNNAAISHTSQLYA